MDSQEMNAVLEIVRMPAEQVFRPALEGDRQARTLRLGRVEYRLADTGFEQQVADIGIERLVLPDRLPMHAAEDQQVMVLGQVSQRAGRFRTLCRATGSRTCR